MNRTQGSSPMIGPRRTGAAAINPPQALDAGLAVQQLC